MAIILIKEHLYRSEHLGAMRRFADFIVQENKRFLLFLVKQKISKAPLRFFCIRYYSKTKRKPAKKNTGLWFSIKLETTCKNSAHLDEKKKNGPNFDIEWLCPDAFNCK